MRNLFFILVIFSSAPCFAESWNKKILAEYTSAKSYEELFCANSAKTKSCLFYKKKLGAAFSATPLEITMESPDVLFVTTKKSLIKVTSLRGNKFTVNGHELDLQSLESRDALRTAILKSLPRRYSFQGPWWMATANAFTIEGTATYEAQRRSPPTGQSVAPLEATGQADLEVIASIDYLVIKAKAFNSCQDISEFVQACTDKTQFSGRALGQTEKASVSPQLKDHEQQIKVVDEYLKGLNGLANKIQKNRTPAFNSTLANCSRDNANLKGLFNECVSDIQKTAKTLKRMQTTMSEQVKQYYSQVQEQISTLGADEEMEDEEHEADLQYVPSKKRADPTQTILKSNKGTR
jgi:hypothetical protein